jgi:hypothetical protein
VVVAAAVLVSLLAAAGWPLSCGATAGELTTVGDWRPGVDPPEAAWVDPDPC